MTYGYCRVSTLDQNNDKFQSEILKYCNNKDLGKVVWIEEKISGTKDWKNRQLGNLIHNICKEGDHIVCSELSRISRSVPQIWEIISICQSKNITLHFLKQNLIIKKDNDITTKVMLNTFSMISELEREFISLRTKESLMVKKQMGLPLGRPKGIVGKSKLDKYSDEIYSFLNNGSSQKWISNHYGCSTVCLYQWLKRHPQTV